MKLPVYSTHLPASEDIIQRNEGGNSCLPTATLDRVLALSDSLWKEVMSLPLSTIPQLHKSLMIYALILVDIQHILSSSDPVNISDDTVDRRLDDFLLQFQVALDLVKGPTEERSIANLTTNNSTHFFQNSHHIIISGENFCATNTNPVIHDPVLREQSHKILQAIYIQSVVLFSYSPATPRSSCP